MTLSNCTGATKIEREREKEREGERGRERERKRERERQINATRLIHSAIHGRASTLEQDLVQ